MSNVNKIIKYGIESEVDPLLDDGVSVYKIAEIISTNHQDNPELRNCSHMVPQRYKETREKDKINDIIEAGKDPTDVINKEFISKLNEIIERFKKWSDEAESLYEEAKTDGTLMERVKILKEIRDNIAQERKSLESLKQYGTRQQSNIYNISLKKEQNFKLQMIDIAKDLCSDCSKKALSRLSKIVVDDVESK